MLVKLQDHSMVEQSLSGYHIMTSPWYFSTEPHINCFNLVSDIIKIELTQYSGIQTGSTYI